MAEGSPVGSNHPARQSTSRDVAGLEGIRHLVLRTVEVRRVLSTAVDTLPRLAEERCKEVALEGRETMWWSLSISTRPANC